MLPGGSLQPAVQGAESETRAPRSRGVRERLEFLEAGVAVICRHSMSENTDAQRTLEV